MVNPEPEASLNQILMDLAVLLRGMREDLRAGLAFPGDTEVLQKLFLSQTFAADLDHLELPAFEDDRETCSFGESSE